MSFKLTILIALLCCALGAVENSIVPVVERFEQVKNLPRKKYSPDQYLEITSSLARKEEKIRLVTYNVLFNLKDEKLSEENRWSRRLPRVVKLIEEMRPDVIGVQELYPDQLEDLLPYLQESFAFYTPRIESGEINGIFYRKDRFEWVDGSVWITPGYSKIRIAEMLTMAQLRDRKTGKEVAFFNAHFPFSTPNERGAYVRNMIGYMAPFLERMPVILMGDLNTFPNRPDLDLLPFYDGDYLGRVLARKGLGDARGLALLGHVGPLSTFSNAADSPEPFQGVGTPGVFLDHVFVSKGISVLIHAVQSGTVDGHFPSDHFPLLVDFISD